MSMGHTYPAPASRSPTQRESNVIRDDRDPADSMSDKPPIHIDDVEPESWEVGELRATRRRLAAAFDARRIGVAIIEIAPGRRSTPPHSHADEDEAFLVLGGSGLSYQVDKRGQARTFKVGVDDLIWHPSNGDAHTLIAGDDGLTVLVAAEGSRTNITYLPRANQFWLGPRWSPAEAAHPFKADAELGPLAIPEPGGDRPPVIRNLAELDIDEGREGRLAYATRGIHQMGAERLVLAQDEMPPDTHNTDLHFHSAREEAWFVRTGSGIARLGEDAHPLRAGSFWLARENTGTGHRIEVGQNGMQLVTIGDLIPGDVCVYPEKRTFKAARGLELPY
jgi:uncharacterized cupin superfamily protein